MNFDTFDFQPADTLFCRDQRPLAAGSGYGHGAEWPLPTVLHGALRSALLQAAQVNPRQMEPVKRKTGEERRIGAHEFDWLRVKGPFPAKREGSGETLYFPAPRDIVPSGAMQIGFLRIIEARGASDLPEPLKAIAANFSPPTKDSVPGWVSEEFYRKYLQGDEGIEIPQQPKLWASERRTGVKIDPDLHHAEDQKLYVAEHMRLDDSVRLRFAANRPPEHIEKKGDREERGVHPRLLVADGRSPVLQLGGERRFGFLAEAPRALELPRVELADSVFIKWVLLTPAIFAHGWLPGWIKRSGDANEGDPGDILLRQVDAKLRRDRRHEAKTRPGHFDKASDKPRIRAKLIAACVGKPQTIGGWHLAGGTDAKGGAPRPTYLAVPSGSVYYFQASSPEEGALLAKVLTGSCRSDYFGEKGLGFGVCGRWDHQSNLKPTLS